MAYWCQALLNIQTPKPAQRPIVTMGLAESASVPVKQQTIKRAANSRIKTNNPYALNHEYLSQSPSLPLSEVGKGFVIDALIGEIDSPGVVVF